MCIDSKEINNRFQLSWELLSTCPSPKSSDRTRESISRLNRSLKWALAYTNLRSYCGQIIKPYSQHYSIIIKRFWVQYFEYNFLSDKPPVIQDFFEWYCDSSIIKEEEIILI